ncbi:MFS transporter, DHA1 family, inner membrane transport protein [Cupriavidus metallidurans]|jgi:DHA1 family inner membrane transport protein|uniref:Transporter, major facilitator superfamily (MFS) n=1 Tax=Cupriavidus metallidurans (strain ATCC 43123 / DSM 2839 / NBRC 102507 / CH34) TaxID=266264 RepID=Q1LCA1_CUPMC|nr:MFS transporter [Cupriavidus metallidurans]ABF12225.1 transporter, major facilitator superfamily (MFS) [Cupriavidus metallidurans CH34]AVA35662.1 MFS transporter [Cupriavidus metallidurans]KWW35489.1 Inner membrane transport protein YdhP [Cupriavidus metallidurans]MDE4921630.1 MFS transporter [Cupriavidus metallidurans]QGS32526.1 MFS transporter [Cupriavidus metallidurans]
MKSNTALLALAIGAFGIGTTEFTPMGLLPVIAEGVNVSIPTAGMLITAYAIGVMVGAPVMTLLFSRFGKRTALMALMAIFTIGNLLSALAPGYGTLLASRLVTSLNHGAFFGLGSVVAASVVPKEKQASAVATMFMGLTIANIGGVPAATWIGQQVGWRLAFAGTAALGLVAIAALWLALPKGERGTRPNVRRELTVLTHPTVLLAMATTVLGAGAMFTLYTYVAPMLAKLTGASDNFVALGLVLIGVGFTIGNHLGGKLADRSLDGATTTFLTALAVIMLVLPFALQSHVGAAVGLLVWGAAAFAVVPPLQMRVMEAAAEAPGLASSINVGAFNLGNAVGAALGGGVISLGLGYAVVPVAGGLLAASGVLLVWLGRASKRAGQPVKA